MTIGVGDGATGAVMLVVLALAAAVMVAGAIAYRRAERERLARLRSAVEARGWTFTPRDDALAERFQVRPLGGGDRRLAREIVTGERGGRGFQAFRFTVIDHRRDSKGRRRTQRTDFEVVWIPLSRSLPDLRLAPDDAVQRLLTGLGWGDVDTESHAFNQRWRVTTRDDAYAHAILGPHVIDELLDPGWRDAAVIVEGPALIWVRRGRPDLAALDAALDRLEALADAVPAFVLADYGR